MLEQFQYASREEFLTLLPELNTVRSLGLWSIEYILGFRTSIQLYLEREFIEPLEEALYPSLFGIVSERDILIAKYSKADKIFHSCPRVLSNEYLWQLKNQRKPLVSTLLSFEDYFDLSILKNDFRFLSLAGVIQYLRAQETPSIHQRALTDPTREIIQLVIDQCQARRNK